MTSLPSRGPAALPTGAMAVTGAGVVLIAGITLSFRDDLSILTVSLLIAAALGLLGLLARATLRRRRARPAAAPDSPALQGFDELDQAILAQLARAVGLSEGSTLKTIGQVNSLREMSSRLITYLQSAREQSDRMQAEIDLNGRIVGELTAFVERMPKQIAKERANLDTLVKEVGQLSSITETIRGMARQTEILSINAAIAAAHAGEAGRAFSVLAGEVRRLATESTKSALEIDEHIGRLVKTVAERSTGEFEQSMRDNEAEAARLLALTGKLDEGYLDMRQFYAMLLTAVTEHNTDLDQGIHALLETGQSHDVAKQIIDRIQPAFESRKAVNEALIRALAARTGDLAPIEARALALAPEYLSREAAHRDPDVGAHEAPGEPGKRIELF